VGVRGRDAAEYLQRMVSNDVAGLAPGSSCEALLLTAKARVIAPLVVLRRAEDDFLLLTEPELGERVRAELLRSRFAAKATVEPEEHRSTLVLGGDPADGIPTLAYGEPAVEVVDAEVAGEPVPADELELLRIRARTPAWGREIDDRVMPAEAGFVEGAVSLTKGCYPGQEPIARLHYRGHANRSLRVLEIDSAEPPSYDAEVILDGKTVGRVTSAVREGDRVIALGYVRREVPDDASLSVEGARARLH
jgi:folate-binding protein YgfZ